MSLEGSDEDEVIFGVAEDLIACEVVVDDTLEDLDRERVLYGEDEGSRRWTSAVRERARLSALVTTSTVASSYQQT